MVTLLNADIRLRAEHRGPDLDGARARVRKLEQQDANLRRALRTAGPRATERITLEIETLRAELAAATAHSPFVLTTSCYLELARSSRRTKAC